MNDKIKEIIRESIATKQRILDDAEMIETLRKVSEVTAHALKNGNKVLFCGNGGSAADAQHIAAELSGRFYSDRDPLPAVNESLVAQTAC